MIHAGVTKRLWHCQGHNRLDLPTIILFCEITIAVATDGHHHNLSGILLQGNPPNSAGLAMPVRASCDMKAVFLLEQTDLANMTNRAAQQGLSAQGGKQNGSKRFP